VTSTLLAGGPIVSCEPGAPDAEALLVKNGRIAAIGSIEEVERRGAGAERVDLNGAAVLPGFIDPHHHYSTAAFDRRSPDLHMPPGAGVADVLIRVQRHVESTPGAGWVRLLGYDPSRLRERRPPSRIELDEICPDRPLLVMAYSFHDAVLNSAGFAAMGWSRSTPNPPGGVLVRSRNGELTGEIREAPFFLAEAASRTAMLAVGEDAWLAEANEHGRALLRAGLVRVADPTVDPDSERLYLRAVDSGLLPVVVHRMPVGPASVLEPRVDAEPTGSGPAQSPVGPAKLFLDGADRCGICASSLDLARAALRTLRMVGTHGLAALRAAARVERFHRGADGLWHRGINFWHTDGLADAIAQASEAGLQVAQHAIGNEAVTQALDAFERAGAGLHELPGRPRVEHAMFLDPGLERRLGSSGAMAVVQPLFVRELGDEFRRIGFPGRLRVIGYRAMIDAGVPLAGSSDYPVAGYEPLAAIQAAVTRRTSSGKTFQPDQAITIEEGLRMYTLDAARALGVEDEAGSLVEGKRADLVVLGADPREADPQQLAAIPVLRAYVGGAPAFTTGG
jgi:predicted amidohydrolase YtcJ